MIKINKEYPKNSHCIFNGKPVHSIRETYPPLPYRNWRYYFVGQDRSKNAKSSLKWISHTGGENKFAFYTCINVFTAMQIGFNPQIVHHSDDITDVWFPALAWEDWSESLSDLYGNIYGMKYEAHVAGNSSKEAACKHVANGTIGKFAMNPIILTDKFFLKTGEMRENTTMYHINAFCMDYKNRISLGLVSWVVMGEPHPTPEQIYNLFGSEDIIEYKRYLIYSDTDNAIFLTTQTALEIDVLMKEQKVLTDGKLGNYDPKSGLFDWKIETESCGRCKGRNFQLMYILARKFYFLRCYCGMVRVKSKGHPVAPMICKHCRCNCKSCKCDSPFFEEDTSESSVGIQALKFTDKLLSIAEEGNEDIIYTLTPDIHCVCKDCIQVRLKHIFGSDYQDNSGKRFSIQKYVPSSRKSVFELFSTHRLRTIGVSVPEMQRICTFCRYCFFFEDI